MKKLILLLSIATILIFASCSKDEEPLMYNDDIGYLSNITSVKHGIIGTWNTTGMTYIYTNDKVYIGESTNTHFYTNYGISYKNNIFFLCTYPADGVVLEWEIIKLNKLDLHLKYHNRSDTTKYIRKNQIE